MARTSDPATVDDFLDQRCLDDPRWFETAADLWLAYNAFSAAADREPVSRTAFGRGLGRRGYRKHHGHTVTWNGVCLRTDTHVADG